jgi:large subunit ribosomal protein L23
MKNPHEIIIKPHITEKSVAMSYGDERAALKRAQNEAKAAGKKPGDAKFGDESLVRKYTFIVATNANKIEIKQAFEAIYNEGRKADQTVKVTNVHTVNLPGKQKRRGRSVGMTSGRRKAVITLAAGQMLEDYGV